MTRVVAFVVALLTLGVAPRLAQAEDYYALVVTGATGDASYVELFTTWRQRLIDGLRDQTGFRDDHLLVLSETPGPGVGTASAEGVREALTELRGRVTTESVLLVVLIGHGTDDGVEPKFNLVGPDLGAEDWDRLLDELPGRIVFVNTTASSFSFVEALAAPGRVVITATASPIQRYDTVFPRFFVEALGEAETDADKDGRISVWEAFAATSRRVRRWYQQQGRLATERALLDDSGDGVGEDADTRDADGHLAARLHLGAGVTPPGPDHDPALAPLVSRREALETEIAALRAARATMTPAAYQRDLETLLVELARVSRRIRDAMQEL